MIRNNLKFAIRNVTRNKTYSAINIAGLALSLCAFILMALYIEDELSFDAFNKNAGDIYRVADDKQTPDVLLRTAQTAAPVGPALLQDFPEIQQAVRLIQAESLIRYDDKIFEERRIFFSDNNLMKVFSFTMLKGNADNALKEPSNIVLTASMASKYFGDADPMGKILSVDGKYMTVTGVLDDIPGSSHLQFDFLVSMSTAEQIGSGYDWLFTNWYSNNFYTYILLPANYDKNRLTAQLSDFDKRHREANSITVHHYSLEQLRDIYLHSDRDNQVGKTGGLNSLYIFSAVAIFLLLISCINFINLSTARSAVRAKEVGIKKVAGAARIQMISQFFTESFLLTLISIITALVLAGALLPSFNAFSGKALSLDILSPLHITVPLLLILVVGILSGSYPAFILSGFKPATALKGKISASAWSTRIRKGLVVFQFAISVILIICSIVVYTQMNYLQDHDLGFKPSQTMVINFEGDFNVTRRLNAIKKELLDVPGVKNITASSNVPGDRSGSTWSMDFEKKNGDTIHTELPIYLTDYNFLMQYDIPIIAGRAFSEQYPADTIESMLLNETAVKKLGFGSPADALGVAVGMYPNKGKITGVFKDFHFQSLQKPVAPLAMRMMPNNFRLLSAQLNTSDIKQTVATIKNKWKTLAPERPLEYTFLDENFNRQYEAEIRFGQVFAIFTVIAISIACLGLFGLALFSVQQRTKEIGIRKVLGAGIGNITVTLGKEFISLVSIAIVIASPAAWYFMSTWLQDFAYRVPISIWMFIVAGLSAIFIAVITISFHTIKAASANPVKSLRTE